MTAKVSEGIDEKTPHHKYVKRPRYGIFITTNDLLELSGSFLEVLYGADAEMLVIKCRFMEENSLRMEI